MLIKNWKTSLAGIVSILTTIVKVMNNGWSFGAEDIAVVVAGLGLIFSKDKNVTGGTTAQYTPYEVEKEKQTVT